MAWILICFGLSFLAYRSFGFGPECKVSAEDFTIDYVDKRYAEAIGSVYKYKGQNHINLTLIWKVDLPEDTRIHVKGLKWVRNDYKLVIFNIERSFKSLLEMDMFGIQAMIQEYIRPAAVWPLHKNVPYRLTKFYIDGSKFPPGLPDGKWLVTTEISFFNKTKIVAMSYKILIQYD